MTKHKFAAAAIKASEVLKNGYVITTGRHRYLCAQKIGIKQVPCLIYSQVHGAAPVSGFINPNNVI